MHSLTEDFLDTYREHTTEMDSETGSQEKYTIILKTLYTVELSMSDLLVKSQGIPQ